MTDPTYKTIDQLPPGTPASSDNVEFSQSGTSHRATFGQFVSTPGLLPFLPLTGGTLSDDLLVDDPASTSLVRVSKVGWVELLHGGAGNPAIDWQTLDAPATQKNWQMGSEATQQAMILGAMSDDFNTTLNAWTFFRNGSMTLPGALTGTTVTMTGAAKVQSATAIPAGGTAGVGFTFSSTANFGTIFGSGAPTASMARGSLYLRSDGSPYVNLNGTTTWGQLALLTDIPTVAGVYQPLDSGLTALAGIGTGMIANTAADTFAPRTITGTASRLAVTNGSGVAGNPTLDIDSAYVGQNTITTLGTVATGTWNGAVIAGQYGGTGVANTGKTITLGGNLTTSGAFASTFTMTGITGVTFPTSGTLATTGVYLPLTGGALAGPGNLTIAGTLGVTGALTGTTATLNSPDNLVTTNIVTALPNNGSLGVGIWYSGVRAIAANTDLHLGGNGTGAIRTDTFITPNVDNTMPLGGASARWSVVYAGTGTINTSGADEKVEISKPSEAEQRAAVRIKATGPKRYKFKDALIAKGGKARWHIGYVAEDVRDALAAEGLDPWAYGLLCADEVEGYTRLGLRYDELQSFLAIAP